MLLRQSLNSSVVNVIRKTVVGSSIKRNLHYRLSTNSLIAANNHFSNTFAVQPVSCERTFAICLQTRAYSASKMSNIATYEEVKDLPNHPEKLLIDVRNPNELEETGIIPTSINIPLPTLEENLKLSADAFKAKFGRDKPAVNAEVIFHCKMGGRAQKGADLAAQLGFKNTRNYKGSWTEWAEKEGLNK